MRGPQTLAPFLKPQLRRRIMATALGFKLRKNIVEMEFRPRNRGKSEIRQNEPNEIFVRRQSLEDGCASMKEDA
jgi:hypothetical protein